MDRRQFYGIFRKAFLGWLEINATIRAAALTFFIILPLPTLLLIVTAIFAQFFGETQAVQILIQQISVVVGPTVAQLFSQLIVSTGSPFTSVWTAVVVIGFSIGGAIGAFSVLRDTMDCIWEVTLPSGAPFWNRVKQKIVPFGLVSALGLIVIAWTAAEGSLINAITRFSVNEILTFVALEIVQVLLSFGIAVLLLAIIYKMIPEAEVHWQDVYLAAIVTGVAFTITNYAFGAYIQTFTVTTVAGAAGSLLIILLWIFVLNQIVLFGAEISKVYATTVGIHSQLHLPKPVEKAVKPLTIAGEKIESLAKEDVVKTKQPSTEPEKRQVEEKGHIPSKKQIRPPLPESESQAKPEAAEKPYEADLRLKSGGEEEGSVEVNVKLKRAKKKRRVKV